MSSIFTNEESFLIIAFAIWGIIQFIRTIILIIKSEKTINWKKTKGVITHSVVIRKSGDRSMGFGPIYYPLIRFEYEVEEVKYESNNVYFGVKLSTLFRKKKSYRIASKYKIGQYINVFYNPNKQKEAVLELAAHNELYVYLIFSLIKIGIAYFTLNLAIV